MVNDKYICVFCDERKHVSTAFKTSGKIGICRDCFASLDKTAPSQPYFGTKDIAYVMSPFEYANKMRKAILDFKFNNCYAYAPLFAMLTEEYLDSYGSLWEEFDYLVPVPLHKSRIKERGYNQSELVARHIAEYLGIELGTDILERTRATKRQSTLQKADRVSNVRNAFKCNCDLTGKRILLFDDICTTRSTLQSCAAALRECNPADIRALTLSIQIEDILPIITY